MLMWRATLVLFAVALRINGGPDVDKWSWQRMALLIALIVSMSISMLARDPACDLEDNHERRDPSPPA